MSYNLIVLIGMLVLAAGLETAIFILPQPGFAGRRQAAVYQRMRSPRDVVTPLDARTE